MNMNPAKYEYQSEFAKRYVAEGRSEGLVEGRAALLIRLLTRRFGELPDSAIARVRSASVPELEAMGDSVLTAQSLEEIFKVV